MLKCQAYIRDMFIPRRTQTLPSLNSNDPRTVPVIIATRLNSPACGLLTAEQESAAAVTIVNQRAAVWRALATFADGLGCALSSACVEWAHDNDADDEALIALVACALALRSSAVDTVRALAACLKRSKDRLAEHNLRLVVSLARRHGHNTGYILPMSDLISEGALGLMKAVCRFDPARGFRFSTMASWWIAHHITRAIADKSRVIHLPVYIAEGKCKINRAIATLAKAGIDAPTDTMISRECTRHSLTEAGKKAAKKAGRPEPAPPTHEEVERGMVAAQQTTAMTPKRVKAVREAMGVYSVSGSAAIHDGGGDGESDKRELLDFFESSAPPADIELQIAERSAILDTALATLSPTGSAILRRRFGLDGVEPMTLRELGEDATLDLNVSRERIRQIEAKAIIGARRAMVNRGIAAGDVAWA